jgi:hypothetical protein
MQFESLHLGVKLLNRHADYGIKGRSLDVAGIRLVEIVEGFQHLQTKPALVASGKPSAAAYI